MLGSKHVTIPKIKSSNYVGVRHFPKDSILSKESPRMGVPRSPAANCKNSLSPDHPRLIARIRSLSPAVAHQQGFRKPSKQGDDEDKSLLTPRIHRICTSLGWDTSMLYLAREITGVAPCETWHVFSHISALTLLWKPEHKRSNFLWVSFAEIHSNLFVSFCFCSIPGSWYYHSFCKLVLCYWR